MNRSLDELWIVDSVDLDAGRQFFDRVVIGHGEIRHNPNMLVLTENNMFQLMKLIIIIPLEPCQTQNKYM